MITLLVLVVVSTAVDAPRWVAALYVEAQKMVGLRWMAAPGATAYTVPRSETAGSGYMPIARTAQPQHFDKDIEPGTTYYYVLQAMAGTEVSTSSEERSVVVPGLNKKDLTPPEWNEVKAHSGTEFGKSTSKVGLDWPEVPGAAGYKVYRTKTPGSAYELVTSTSESASVDTAVESGETYHYVVTALTDSFEETPFSEEKSVTVAGPKDVKSKRSRKLLAAGSPAPPTPVPSPTVAKAGPSGRKRTGGSYKTAYEAPRKSVSRPPPALSRPESRPDGPTTIGSSTTT